MGVPDFKYKNFTSILKAGSHMNGKKKKNITKQKWSDRRWSQNQVPNILQSCGSDYRNCLRSYAILRSSSRKAQRREMFLSAAFNLLRFHLPPYLWMTYVYNDNKALLKQSNEISMQENKNNTQLKIEGFCVASSLSKFSDLKKKKLFKYHHACHHPLNQSWLCFFSMATRLRV